MKMWKLAALALVLCCWLPPVHADESGGMGTKLLRGSVNLVTGPLEVPMQITKGFETGSSFVDHPTASATLGSTGGFFRGLHHFVGRSGHGLFEVASFWAVAPKSNRGVGIPLDGVHAWHPGRPHSFTRPGVARGFAPVGQKLVRGVVNLGLGLPFELANEISLGVANKRPTRGVMRGFWFGFSRTFNGLGDTFLFFAPNPRDRAGYALEHEWPWWMWVDEPI